MAEIELVNKFIVGVLADKIVIGAPPCGTISRPDALNLAAWLVALADREDRFPQVLEAVQNT